MNATPSPQQPQANHVGSPTLTRGQRLAIVAAQCMAAAAGFFYGFDFGVQVAGLWLGLLAALNTAFFAALFTSSAADWAFRRRA